MKWKIKTAFILLSCISYTITIGQNETSKWYFGKYAGLDFSTNPPTSLTNGAMNTSEGCASIADAAGNLLFYTNGVNVWDKSHNIMANGSGLFGHTSTSQAAIIVKQPGSTTKYIVFTLDQLSQANGLQYSIVDMSLAAGMGSVTVKNTLLLTPSSEKMTAIKHCNGNDVWVVTHDGSSNDFYTFLVSVAGVNSTAVVSSFTNTSLLSYQTGCMKISPRGNKLGLTIYSSAGTPSTLGSFELYDFDNSTGIVSNRLPLVNTPSAYGCEFSPDGSKFYGVASTTFFQWNLCQSSTSLIVASQFSLATINFKQSV